AAFIRCVVASTALFAMTAAAVGDSLRFDIPSQPMPGALKAFAAQAKMQLLYRYDAVRGATANPVIGDYEKRTALELLLQGTGLEVVYSKDDAATIAPPAREPRTSRAPAASERPLRVASASAGTNGAAPTLAAALPQAAAASAPASGDIEEVIVTGIRSS